MSDTNSRDNAVKRTATVVNLRPAPRYSGLKKWRRPSNVSSKDSTHAEYIFRALHDGRLHPSEVSERDMRDAWAFGVGSGKQYRRRGVMIDRDNCWWAIVQKVRARYEEYDDPDLEACKWLEGAMNVEGRAIEDRGGPFKDKDPEIERLVKEAVQIELWLDQAGAGKAGRTEKNSEPDNAEIRSRFATAVQIYRRLVRAGKIPTKTTG